MLAGGDELLGQQLAQAAGACRAWSGGMFVFVDEAVRSGSFERVEGAASGQSCCRRGWCAGVVAGVASGAATEFKPSPISAPTAATT